MKIPSSKKVQPRAYGRFEMDGWHYDRLPILPAALSPLKRHQVSKLSQSDMKMLQVKTQ
jgi:hypothetical protein